MKRILLFKIVLATYERGITDFIIPESIFMCYQSLKNV